MATTIKIKQIDLQGILSASSQVDLLSASNYTSFVNQLDTTMSSDAELTAVSSSISQSIYTINQTLGSSLVSSSSQLTSSFDERYILSGSIPSIPTESFATTGSNIFIGNQTISGSLVVSQIISNNAPTVGDNVVAGETGITYSGRIAIFREDTFSVGVWTDVQIGWTVTDNNGFTDTIASIGGFGVASFVTNVNNWPSPASGKTYVFTSPDYQQGYINSITISVGDNDWIFDKDTGLTFPDETIQTTAFISATFVTTSSFNEYTSSQSTSSLVDRLNTIESETGSYLTNLNGTISGSSQLTSSFDERYVLSGSITLSSLNEFTSSAVRRTSVPTSLIGSEGDIDGMIAFDSGAIYFANGTYYGTGPFVVSLYESTDNSPNFPITKGNFPKPKIGWTINVSNGFIVATITNVVEYTDYWLVYTNGGNSGVTAPATITLTTNEVLDNIWLKQEFISSSIINSLNSYTASLKATTLISGSSQLTSSLDTRFTLRGSISSVPLGTISGSSQLTSSYDSRYSLSGSVLTSFSSSVDNRLDTLEATIISGSPNYTQVLGNRRTNITSEGISIISGSITTTGNPVQIMVTGDANPVNVTSWARLQIFRDGNPIGGIVQVENSSNLNVPYCLNVIDTPSAGTYTYSMRTVSGFSGTFDFGEASGPILTAVELNSKTSFPSGTISGSSQLTSSYDSRYLTIGGDSVISGSSQLTSSFDTRYALSASFVSSSNVASIQTITSASYAALTPVSGTLYIIIG